jgi:surface carbohydrate biosynthesis protein (TIGR04326 family)
MFPNAKTITIWDKCETIPEGEVGYVWNGYQNEGGGQSLLSLLESQSDDIRRLYFKVRTDFFSKLLQSINSFQSSTKIEKMMLWMSILTESSIYKSTCVINTLRLLVLEQELKNKDINGIRYVGHDKFVAEALRLLCNKSKLKFYFIKNKNQEVDSLLKKIWYSLPKPICSLIWLLRYLHLHWPLRQLDKPNWFEGPKALFVFSYFAHLDKDSCESGIFYSRQWGTLPEFLKKKGKMINWSHLFLLSEVIPNTRIGIGWLKSFNKIPKEQGNHYFIHSFLDLRLVLTILFDWLRIQVYFFKYGQKFDSQLENLQYSWLWPLFKKDWSDSMIGVTAMRNIFMVHLFDRLLSDIPHQEQGLYLCENQGWERAFLQAWHKNGHGRIIGVAHSTIRYWDLRYYDASITTISDIPRPDALAVNGPRNWANLKKAGHPMESCIKVEATRYLHFQETSIDSDKKLSLIDGKRRLLILGDIQSETTHHMLMLLECVASKLNLSYEIWFKTHPHNKIKLDKYTKLKVIVKNCSMEKLLPMIDATISSALTSAEIDSYCYSVPMIIFLSPYDINFSNLKDVDGINFVSTVNELSQALDKIYSAENIKNKPDDIFWLDPKLTMWNELLEFKE